MHILSNEEKEKWIEDDVVREPAVGRQRVPDAEAAIMHDVSDMTTAERMGATTRKPETRFEEMLNAIADSLSDLASPDNEQDREDQEDDEDDTVLSKLSDDDDPGWVMGTMSESVQHHVESFRQKQMRLDQSIQPGWGDAANYLRETDMKYETTEMKVLVVVKPQIDMTAATPPPTTFGQPMQTLDIVCRQSQIPAVTSRPGSSQTRLGCEWPQLHKFLQVVSANGAPDSTLLQDAKPVQPVSVHPYIEHP